MNYWTIALVTEAELDAEYAWVADKAIILGKGPTQESFLNINKIIEISKREKIYALHPGYGFLSENVNLVQKCEENGIKFIGPDSKTMKMMGAKDVSKEIMIKNNIPVIPGYYSDNQEMTHLREESEKIGYPVIIKAVLGGGGKGMRVVKNSEEFEEMLKFC